MAVNKAALGVGLGLGLPLLALAIWLSIMLTMPCSSTQRQAANAAFESAIRRPQSQTGFNVEKAKANKANIISRLANNNASKARGEACTNLSANVTTYMKLCSDEGITSYCADLSKLNGPPYCTPTRVIPTIVNQVPCILVRDNLDNKLFNAKDLEEQSQTATATTPS